MRDVFEVIAQPTRRRILDRLRDDEASVSDLGAALGLSQPAISKHLKVLREHGLVKSHVDAQRRIYTLEHRPLLEVDAWLRAYRERWHRQVDALAQHLDQQSEEKGIS